jgi:HNH endonuclease
VGGCSIPGCKRDASARELCRRHYQRLQRTGSPTGTTRASFEERFWAKVSLRGSVPEVRPDLGRCWAWNGTTSNGYGQIHLHDRLVYTHRVSYEMLVGPIPDGLVIDHLCRNHGCCNPDHLEPVTNKANILRGIGATAVNKQKLACVHGHPFTPENTYWYAGPHGPKRKCQTCKRGIDQRRRIR